MKVHFYKRWLWAGSFLWFQRLVCICPVCILKLTLLSCHSSGFPVFLLWLLLCSLGEREQEPHHSLVLRCLGISSTKQASPSLLNSTLPSPQGSLLEYSMHDGLESRSRWSSRSTDTSLAGDRLSASLAVLVFGTPLSSAYSALFPTLPKKPVRR